MKTYFRSIAPVPFPVIPAVIETYTEQGWDYVDSLPIGVVIKKSSIINNSRPQGESIPAFMLMFRVSSDFSCPEFPKVNLDDLMK